MIVTLTSKGQPTLPKAIREQMKLDAGSKLDFSVEKDGTLRVRPLTHKVADLVGILHRPGMKPAMLQQMHESRERHLAEKHERILRTGSSAAPGKAASKALR